MGNSKSFIQDEADSKSIKESVPESPNPLEAHDHVEAHDRVESLIFNQIKQLDGANDNDNDEWTLIKEKIESAPIKVKQVQNSQRQTKTVDELNNQLAGAYANKNKNSLAKLESDRANMKKLEKRGRLSQQKRLYTCPQVYSKKQKKQYNNNIKLNRGDRQINNYKRQKYA